MSSVSLCGGSLFVVWSLAGWYLVVSGFGVCKCSHTGHFKESALSLQNGCPALWQCAWDSPSIPTSTQYVRLLLKAVLCFVFLRPDLAVLLL